LPDIRVADRRVKNRQKSPLWRVRHNSGAQQLRQLGNVGGDPPRLVAGET
jgi:hypothetical protein